MKWQWDRCPTKHSHFYISIIPQMRHTHLNTTLIIRTWKWSLGMLHKKKHFQKLGIANRKTLPYYESIHFKVFVIQIMHVSCVCCLCMPIHGYNKQQRTYPTQKHLCSKMGTQICNQRKGSQNLRNAITQIISNSTQVTKCRHRIETVAYFLHLNYLKNHTAYGQSKFPFPCIFHPEHFGCDKHF